MADSTDAGARSTKRRHVTLATVAERAAVSVTTVSAVLSGREGLLRLYRPETIARVREVAERLGYRANLFATGLPLKKPPFFALVLQDLRKEWLGTWHLWGYEGWLLAGAVGTAMERHLYPVTATIGRDADGDDLREASRLIDGGVFGTIVRTPNSSFESFLHQRYESGHPIVVVFPRRPSFWATNVIDVDNHAVGETAARILADRRRKTWALIRYTKLSASDQLRCEAFLRFARESGKDVRVIRVPGDVEVLAVRDLVDSHVRRLRPDALFAPESVSAVSSLLACVNVGLRPTEDFDLIGCDCASWYSMDLPTITCVDVSWEQVGVRAVEELARMCQKNTSRFDTILMNPRVVAGGTCPVPARFHPVSPQDTGSADGSAPAPW